MQSTPIARHARPASTGYATVPVTKLAHGIPLKNPVYDSRNILLLAAGQVVTPTLIESLRRRGIKSARVHESEVTRICPGNSAANASPPEAVPEAPPAGEAIVLPEKPVRRVVLPVRPPNNDYARFSKEVPFAKQIHSPGVTTFNPAQVERTTQSYQHSIADLGGVYSSWLQGQAGDLQRPRDLASRSLTELTSDPDIATRTGLQVSGGNFPLRQSVNTAWLAQAIGARLNLPQSALLELGMGCLLHDVGLLKLNPNCLMQMQQSGNVDRAELSKHPMLTYELLNKNNHVSPTVSLIAYQMHERLDGSGYPRQRRGSQIHPFSRIAAVAHAYVDLVQPRGNQPGLTGYEAIRQILIETHAGLWDRDVTRALLEAVSLVPLGSLVQLNDGRIAEVLRANSSDYTRPVLQMRASPGQAEMLLDLSQTPELEIVEVVSAGTTEAWHGRQAR